jgi:iron complex outermembrane receptor protein
MIPGLRSDYTPAGQNILTRLSRKISDESDWKIQLYWDRTERPERAPQYDYVATMCDTFDLDFQHRFPIGCRHSLIWGMRYRNTHNIVDSSFSMGGIPAARDFAIRSFFVQDQIALSHDLLYLILGSKFSHNDFSGFEYQPTIRLLWTPNEKQSAWAAVSRAVRTPSRADQDIRLHMSGGVDVPAFFQLYGSPDVRSEQLLAWEIGYRAQPTKAFWWDITAFYNQYDDLVTSVQQGIFWDPSTGIIYDQNIYANAGWGDTYGFELASTYQVNSCWKITSGYSFLVMDLKGPRAGEYEHETPRNQVYLISGWDLGRSWKLDMDWRYVDNLPEHNIPSYLVMDVRLAWEPNDNLEVAVVGRNLLNDKHQEFDTSIFYTSEVQNSVYGMITWRR